MPFGKKRAEMTADKATGPDDEDALQGAFPGLVATKV